MVKDWTYGGKLTENVVQAIAADVMLHGMRNAEAAGYEIIMSVHDEVVAEVDEGDEDVEPFNRLLCELPEWAYGIPVKAEGWTDERYHK